MASLYTTFIEPVLPNRTLMLVNPYRSLNVPPDCDGCGHKISSVQYGLDSPLGYGLAIVCRNELCHVIAGFTFCAVANGAVSDK